MFKKISLTFIIILSLGVSYYFYTKDSTKKKLSNEEIVEVVNTLKFEWENANLDKDGICKKISYVDDQYYQCFPEYLQCLLDKKLINLHSKKRLIPVSLNGSYTYHQMPTYRYYDFSISVEGYSDKLSLSFVDSCQETYVPRRFYPFMANKREVTISWDNFNRDIFVDKYLVQNWEIINWNKLDKSKASNSSYEKVKERNKYTYAYGLTVEEMEAYCKFQGKTILSAQVYDAVTIHPEDLTDNKTKYLRAPLYPWERKNTKTLINEIQRKKEFFSDEISKEQKEQLCNRDYSYECLDLNYIQKNGQNVSWTGVYDIFGGPFEYLRNIIHPSENLKLASHYFSWHSKAHQTGMRGYWDGEGLGINNIAFDPLVAKDLNNDYKIAFRCMRSM